MNYQEGLQDTEEIDKELYNADLLVDNKPYQSEVINNYNQVMACVRLLLE